jgi:hypothetical protein
LFSNNIFHFNEIIASFLRKVRMSLSEILIDNVSGTKKPRAEVFKKIHLLLLDTFPTFLFGHMYMSNQTAH